MAIEIRSVPEGAGIVAVALVMGSAAAIARGDDEGEAGDRALTLAADGAGLASFLRPRRPTATESYRNYLEWHGLVGPGCGFVFGELVRSGSPRHMEPPRELWAAMVPTLATAHRLRAVMVDAGARGLIVAAAFRPEGGEAQSRHKRNAALDLDLMPGDERLAGRYLAAASGLLRSYGTALRLGVGTYHPASVKGTRRVHVDAGTRAPTACWQRHNGRYVEPPAVAGM